MDHIWFNPHYALTVTDIATFRENESAFYQLLLFSVTWFRSALYPFVYNSAFPWHRNKIFILEQIARRVHLCVINIKLHHLYAFLLCEFPRTIAIGGFMSPLINWSRAPHLLLSRRMFMFSRISHLFNTYFNWFFLFIAVFRIFLIWRRYLRVPKSANLRYHG